MSLYSLSLHYTIILQNSPTEQQQHMDDATESFLNTPFLIYFIIPLSLTSSGSLSIEVRLPSIYSFILYPIGFFKYYLLPSPTERND